MIKRDINVGDKIRSMDFEGIDNCYIEGTVDSISISNNYYHIEISKVVRNGNEKIFNDVKPYMNTPIESMFDYDARIIKLIY